MQNNITFKLGIELALTKMDKAYSELRLLHSDDQTINPSCISVNQAFDELRWQSKMVFLVKEANWAVNKIIEQQQEHPDRIKT